MSSTVHYPASNLNSPHYSLWHEIWPVEFLYDRANGYHDFSIPEQFPWTKPLHANYEISWDGGPYWTRANRVYWWVSIAVPIFYLFAVYGGKRLMRNRKAFDLKYGLAVWNLFLAVFSFIGATRLVPHLLYGLAINHHSYFFCRSAPEAYGLGVSGLWVTLFIWSKLIELIDTAFLVLRKKPVSFLHWFHHATVLMYCWHAGQYNMPTGIFFATMNYIVHSVMYFYYFLAAITTPPKWGKLVTMMQIGQMFVGMFVTGYHYYALNTIPNCDGSRENLTAAFVMYTAYMLLFVQFFASRYMGSRMQLRSMGPATGKGLKDQ